ncbi:MAG: hypothetical protein DHS80DRAFT_31100 [Piptocephalis tieghemiana]|nr:MAG: hypothetical protein DHS80DRAFT_31100 [Piptocephalis tieghemiana]
MLRHFGLGTVKKPLLWPGQRASISIQHKVKPTSTRHVVIRHMPLPSGRGDVYRLVSRAKIPPEAVQSIVFQREPNTLRATGGVYVELDSPQHGKALVDVCSDSVICGMKLAPHFAGPRPLTNVEPIGAAAGRSVLLSGVPTDVHPDEIPKLVQDYDVAQGIEPWLVPLPRSPGSPYHRYVIKLADSQEAERLVQRLHQWEWKSYPRRSHNPSALAPILLAELLY